MCDIENCDSKEDIKDVNDEKVFKEKMTNSAGSIINDDTPTDSGVALSEGELIDSMISSAGFEEIVEKPIPDLLIPAKNLLSKSDIENNNCNGGNNDDANAVADNMMSSIHSTFDTEIVYRKKIKKLAKSAPKKRVSFHEDILNSTRTDNIHIEHGFITYKGKNKQNSSRYSWCSEYNNEGLDSYVDNSEESAHHVYRNACSEVLDYGQTELNEDEDAKVHARDDKSGIFEYPKFYRCQCSSSSSIDSGSSSENTSKSSDNNQNYQQAKSSSCDCIGSSDNMMEMGHGTYFVSEPNIGKSVWSKEKKPKSSCLKKSKIATVATEAQDRQQKIDSNVKKFNIHKISKKVIKDNASKMIIGSLKDIFGISLPERGVPEGSEDTPEECIPPEQPTTKREDFSFLQKVGLFKPNPTKMQTLSKSLDGGFGNQQKKFIHDVDNQLRRADDEDLFASSSSSSSRKNSLKTDSSVEEKEADEDFTVSVGTRNKFIINCESTVFEHTGTIEMPESMSLISSLDESQLQRKFSNIVNSISGNSNENDEIRSEAEGEASSLISPSSDKNSSIISELSCGTTSTTTASNDYRKQKLQSHQIGGSSHSNHNNKHLSSSPSPMRKKHGGSDRMSPDLFNFNTQSPASQPPLSTNKLLSDSFDDILKSSDETSAVQCCEKDDIVIVDYADIKNDAAGCSNYYLKLPSIMTTSTTSSSSKNSLINRFLRNVTQKKILDASIKRNNFFQSKLKNEKKLFGGDLYVKAKPKDESLIKSLNWEIDMEIEMGMEFDEENVKDNRLSVCSAGSFDFDANDGIGELRTDLFDARELRLFRDQNEILMKAFKLFSGYSNEGNISAVLVFLTDKTIYVVGLIRNKLANKFVLPYAELDVILMGPMGNTVLLSNGARDMQQVMLTCGPYPAEKLISSLEMCARRGGFHLPAVGELTLDHFAPLQAFVCNNSSVSKSDSWKYYSIVSIPAGILGVEEEPLGPCLQGFFMHRHSSHSGVVQKWSAGYFMLKAGVLYLFNDCNQKIPSWAVSLPNECQGAKRCVTSNRPHCFEILLRSGSLQLAAPDEFVASDWLQNVIQAANSLNFEVEERQKILGCTLIMTENHLITLREDFSSPLRRVNPQNHHPIIMPSPSTSLSSKENIDPNLQRKLSNSTILDTISEVSSIRSTPSTPSRGCRSLSSSTTPTKQHKSTYKKQQQNVDESTSHTNMTSFYGKNSGIEVLMCAAIEELTSVKTSDCENSWWCLLEFSCQEVRENFDDLVLLFSTASEMQRFLTMLENLWYTKTDGKFPIGIANNQDDECPQKEQCEKLFLELKNSWLPLIDQLPALNAATN